MIKLKEIIENRKKNPILKLILSGTFWVLSGTAIAKFLILIAGIICARILGDFEYGQLGIIRSTIMLFIVVGSAGLGVTACKYISEYRGKDKKENITSIYWLVTGFAFISGIIITILILFLAPYLSEYNLKAPELVNELRLGAILLFFTVINATQNGILSGFENFRAIGINTLISGIIEAILIIIGAYYFRVGGAIVGYGLSFIILTALNHYSIHKQFKKSNISLSIQLFRKSDIPIIWRFSIPAALNSLMVAPVFWIIRTMLIQSNGFGELGLYEAADQWKVIILFLPSAVSNILLPILTREKDSKETYPKILRYNLLLNIGISLFFAIGISLFSNYIMSFYGNGFDDIYPLIVLSFSTVFTTAALVITTALTSYAKMWISFSFQLMWATLTIVISFILLKLGLGALAIAYAILVSYMILATVQLFYARKVIWKLS